MPNNILTTQERKELTYRIAFEFAFSDLLNLSEYNANSWGGLYDRCILENQLVSKDNEETILCEAYERYDVATALEMTYELADYATKEYEEAMLARNQLAD